MITDDIKFFLGLSYFSVFRMRHEKVKTAFCIVLLMIGLSTVMYHSRQSLAVIIQQNLIKNQSKQNFTADVTQSKDLIAKQSKYPEENQIPVDLTNASKTRTFTKYDSLYEGVKNELINAGKPNNYWYVVNKTEIIPEAESGDSGIVKNGIKLIYGATRTFLATWEDLLSFKGCKYDNCVVGSSLTFKYIEEADVVLYLFRDIQKYPNVSWQTRSKQIWVIYTGESQGYRFNRFPRRFNNIFNATMSFRHESDIFYPFGRAVLMNTTEGQITPNYAAKKRKGAFAYVSNCNSMNYNRMLAMKKLGEHIDVDIFGECTKIFPCKRADWECENRVHSQYHFYFSFENSLCKDYITEKFWSRLKSPHAFVPVVYGGLELHDYTRVAPPDSFIHAYNFTSLDELGQYLKYLMANATAYNRYHAWRNSYRIEPFGYFNTCKLCELANLKPNMPAKSNVSEWWNKPGSCRH